MKQLTSETYRTRAVRFLGHREIKGFRMKVYGIAYQGEHPAQDLCEAAYQLAAERIASSAAATNHYDVGIIGIHEGKGASFVFVDWWADENELHHHVYVSTDDDRLNLEYQTPSGVIACVWDLYVMSFERDAWVNNILKSHPSPDIQGYLDAVLNDDI